MSRVAVVTGGASGMGRSACEHLAAAGSDVAVLDLDGEAALATADHLTGAGVRSIGLQVDVADREAVDRAYEQVRTQLGPIAILVTSAAVASFVRFTDITVEEWERTLRVNLTGTFHCIQLALPDMVGAGWGRIVTISSAAGQAGSRRQGHYSASKGGVIALTKAVALEYGSKGITANTIPPAVVDTPMFREAQAEGHVPDDEMLARMTPVGRLGAPDDIGAMCAYLCSDAASYVTGQVIGVNGGAVT
ncbi:MAG: SDR family NAD(P)-dependent oxidoreductase [Acidimicrobiales bacterium]|nr:SDR family NAD(P)-dependent oxidoreductase [Acidimicrobiales bacterium]